MELPEFVSSLEKIYKPLMDLSFEATYEGRNTTAVATGGPRDILVVQDESTIDILYGIVREVDNLQRKYNKMNGSDEDTERVWKGITTSWGVKLWVPACDDPGCGKFQVADIEVLTDLLWAKQNYIALVNVRVTGVKKMEDSD